MIKRREFKRFNKKAIAFILSFSIIGPGVVTNLIIKDHSSRVRPKNIENFNPKSQKSFTPYYSLKGECSHNCSFISGHVAATFVFVAIAYVLESQTALILAVLFASLMAVSRVVQGGHFLSDVVFTFIINLIILKILYYLFFKESAMIKEKS
jgi:lipid A 4'-phosphatase